jgi:hypothetical protein
MNIEDGSRIGIARGDYAEYEIDLAIRLGVLGEIIKADEGMKTAVRETLCNRNADAGQQKGKQRRGGRVGGNNEGEVVEKKIANELRELGQVEAYADVEREETLGTEPVK